MVDRPLEPDAFDRSKGRALVSGLVIYAFLGLVLFLTFLVIGLRGARQAMPDSLSVTAVKQMVGLEGLSFTQLELVLDDSDYKLLRTHADLRGIANTLRKERQKLAILWIAMLVNDLKKLWRFRRFLVRRGVPAKFGEEVKIACVFLLSFLLLHLLELFIRCSGPFAIPGMARRANRLLEAMSYAPARVLSRIPSAGWAEIEQSWARSSA